MVTLLFRESKRLLIKLLMDSDYSSCAFCSCRPRVITTAWCIGLVHMIFRYRISAIIGYMIDML